MERETARPRFTGEKIVCVGVNECAKYAEENASVSKGVSFHKEIKEHITHCEEKIYATDVAKGSANANDCIVGVDTVNRQYSLDSGISPPE